MPLDPNTVLNAILFLVIMVFILGTAIYKKYSWTSYDRLGATRIHQPDDFDLLAVWVFVAYFAMTQLLQQIPAGSNSDNGSSMSDRITPILLGVSMIIQLFPLLIITVLFIARKISPIDFFGLRMRNAYQLIYFAPAVVLLTVGFGLILQLVNYDYWLQLLFGAEVLKLQETVTFYQEADEVLIRVLIAISVVIIAPIVEEVVFRGYLYPVMKRYTSRIFAIAVTSILFAVVHNTIPGFLPLAFLAVLLAVSYEITESLWAPISIHAVFNGFTLIVQEIEHHH